MSSLDDDSIVTTANASSSTGSMMGSTATDDDGNLGTGTSPYADVTDVTNVEKVLNIVLGIAFLTTALVAARRMSSSLSTTPSSPGAETAVVTAFYTLILLTSVLRAAWFLIPDSVWQPSYTPMAVMAWDESHPSWVGQALSELVVTLGSLALFSIFILILVYWGDILRKYFHPGSRRPVPMMTFIGLVSTLAALLFLNVLLFLGGLYSTEGMILFHAILLAAVSLICVCEITIFSHRFRTVLKTLGAINQVSTDSQIRRIVWITVTGNLFFVTRACLEAIFAGTLLVFWYQHGTVARAFSHVYWDLYVALKYVSEVTILALMLYILQSRFHTAAAAAATVVEREEFPVEHPTTTGTKNGKGSYTRVPDADIAV